MMRSPWSERQRPMPWSHGVYRHRSEFCTGFDGPWKDFASFNRTGGCQLNDCPMRQVKVGRFLQATGIFSMCNVAGPKLTQVHDPSLKAGLLESYAVYSFSAFHLVTQSQKSNW